MTKSKPNRKKKRVQIKTGPAGKTASLEKGYSFWDLADEYMDKGNMAKVAGAVVRAEKLLPPNPDLYKLMVMIADEADNMDLRLQGLVGLYETGELPQKFEPVMIWNLQKAGRYEKPLGLGRPILDKLSRSRKKGVTRLRQDLADVLSSCEYQTKVRPVSLKKSGPPLEKPLHPRRLPQRPPLPAARPTPAVKILFTALIGRKHKSLSMSYNPVTRQIDPLVCHSCGQSIFRIAFCENLHLLCPGCHGKKCHLCTGQVPGKEV